MILKWRQRVAILISIEWWLYMDLHLNTSIGHDYFEHVYFAWLRDEEEDCTKRQSVVLLDECDKVIGYQSFLYMDQGRKVLEQALRIDPKLKGKGVGRRFMELTQEFLLAKRDQVVKKSWNVVHCCVMRVTNMFIWSTLYYFMSYCMYCIRHVFILGLQKLVKRTR